MRKAPKVPIRLAFVSLLLVAILGLGARCGVEPGAATALAPQLSGPIATPALVEVMGRPCEAFDGPASPDGTRSRKRAASRPCPVVATPPAQAHFARRL